MPVWHEKLQAAVESGQIVMLGVVQEQHPDRTRLYAQWQQFGWPILHDPLNLIETSAVPLFVAIDEHGIVRSTRPNVETFADEFLNVDFADDAPPLAEPPLAPPADAWKSLAPHFATPQATAALIAHVGEHEAAEQARQYADGLILWSGANTEKPVEPADAIDRAIAAYALSDKLWPRPLTRFRQGVAYRMRYESAPGQASDFQEAIDLWNAALAEDPNQYIWRRRIQQYGPRLIKPYPFYDWVETAQQEVAARGETPIQLRAALSLAEVAGPSREFTEEAAAENPDPDSKILRDLPAANLVGAADASGGNGNLTSSSLINIETTVVSSTERTGVIATIHFTFTPSDNRQAHWNNEAEPLRLWIDPPQGWQVTRQLLEAPQGDKPETRETRRLSVEIRSDKVLEAPVKVSAFALYNVCEDIGGACQFLRQDVTFEVKPPQYRNR